MKHLFALLAAAALALALGSPPAHAADPAAIKPHGTLELVQYAWTVDGDTVHLRLPGDGPKAKTHKVRLFLVNTPELQPGHAPAFDAAAYTAHALERAKAVYLEHDPAVAPQDAYKRDLGWLWVLTADNQLVLLNLALYQHGLAELYTGPGPLSHEYDSEFGLVIAPGGTSP